MKEFNSDFLPKNPAKKHHYLPVFYLNGFTDEKGLFCVYDKLEKKFHVRQRPENWFFVKHLNSYRPNGELLLTLEEPYHSKMDSQSAPSFERIRNSDPYGHEDIELQDRVQVILFLSMLFWRSPYSDDVFRKLIETEGLSNRYFSFYADAEGNPLSDIELIKIQNEVLSSVENLRVFKQAVPVSNAAIEEGLRLLAKWTLFYMPNSFEDTLIGDSPFVINNPELRLDQVFNEVIIPISKNRMLILADKPPQSVNWLLYSHVNTCILHQSHRHVACANEAYLRSIVEDYEEIRPELSNKELIDATYYLMHGL